MKKADPINEHEESLPFSFLKREVDQEKIKTHWQKIKSKIGSDVPVPKSNKKDNAM